MLAIKMENPERTSNEPYISPLSLEKAQFAKTYIEMKYSKKKREETEKLENWEKLNKQMDDLSFTANEKKLLKEQIMHEEAEMLRETRKGINIFNFEPGDIIGRGAFGEVRIVRDKNTAEVFAMKKLCKTEMIRKNQVQHVKSERNVLALANNPWVVELKYSFQDENHLYLVMEYLPGGDLMTILIKRDIIPEEEARIYIAECILAVESVHKLNYIHRDLKPDNILIDSSGHVKLADFGLCKCSDINLDNPFENLTKLEEDKVEKSATRFLRSRKLAFSTVGTPDYIAPEVFGRGGYDEKVDWWSVGVIFFEMIIGYPPFYADEPKITCQKILNWKRTFKVPKDAKISSSATDLIYKLVCDKEDRLNVDEIKNHVFFNGIDWNSLRKQPAPWVPELSNDMDSRNFDKFEEETAFYPPTPLQTKKPKRKDGNFIGYTFKRQNSQRNSLVAAFENLESCLPGRKSLNPFEPN